MKRSTHTHTVLNLHFYLFLFGVRYIYLLSLSLLLNSDLKRLYCGLVYREHLELIVRQGDQRLRIRPGQNKQKKHSATTKLKG